MGEGSLLPSLTSPKASYFAVGEEGSGLPDSDLGPRSGSLSQSLLSDGPARRWLGRRRGTGSPPPQPREVVWRERETESTGGRVREGSPPRLKWPPGLWDKSWKEICVWERRGGGLGEGTGFDNELETNFISMQACCLSPPAQTEFSGRPGRVGGERGRAEGGDERASEREKRPDHCAILGPSFHPISARPWKPAPNRSPSSQNEIIYLRLGICGPSPPLV